MPRQSDLFDIYSDRMRLRSGLPPFCSTSSFPDARPVEFNEVIDPGDDRQDQGDIEEHHAYHMGVDADERIMDHQGGDREDLAKRLALAERACLDEDPLRGGDCADAVHGKIADDDDGDYPGRDAADRDHQDHRRVDDQLVGDRIEEFPHRRDDLVPPGDVAVQEIGQGRRNKEDGDDETHNPPRGKKKQEKYGDNPDPEHGDGVGEIKDLLFLRRDGQSVKIPLQKIDHGGNLLSGSAYLFFLYIPFKTLLAAKIDRLPVDRRPAGVTHGNIGVAKGILDQLLADRRRFRTRGTGFSPCREKPFPEKEIKEIDYNNGDNT